MKIKYLLFPLVLLFAVSCGKKYTPRERAYIKKIEEERNLKNIQMMSDPNSPFNNPEKIKFHRLKYFPVNPDFVFKSRLYEYPVKKTVTIYGTKGEERKAIRFGFLKIKYKGKEYHLNVYKSFDRKGEAYFSIWFTDETTNKESYGVGRYLEFEKSDDPNFVYTIDFNKAFNPYCAYSPAYSCAIPSREDHLNFAVKAGEKKFHD